MTQLFQEAPALTLAHFGLAINPFTLKVFFLGRRAGILVTVVWCMVACVIKSALQHFPRLVERRWHTDGKQTQPLRDT